MARIVFKKFKFFIFDLISFGSPQAIVLNLSLVFLILLILPSSDVGYVPVRSIYSSVVIPLFFNNSCPTEGIFTNCGFYSIGQIRGLSSFLHGDFELANKYNRLVGVLFFVLLAILLYNLYLSYKYYKKSRKIFPW
jgi:hypothetical protein